MADKLLFILKITLPDVLLVAVVYTSWWIMRVGLHHLGLEWIPQDFDFFIFGFYIVFIVFWRILYFRHELIGINPSILNTYDFSNRPTRKLMTNLNLDGVIAKIRRDMDYAALPMELGDNTIKISIPWSNISYGWQYVQINVKAIEKGRNQIEIESYSRYWFPMFGQLSGLFRNVIKLEKLITS